MRAIPLADAPALRSLRGRTRIVRLALAAALLATAAAAVVEARVPDLGATPILPPGSSGVIALDLSVSAQHGTFDRLYAAITQLAQSKGRFGLVVFSSRAYEALPPDTPASELAPIARFFRPLRTGGTQTFPGAAPFATTAQYPPNPWAYAFSFGTAISAGLDLARTLVLGSHARRPAVWLLSDLADAPQDRPLVRQVAGDYVRSEVALHVIGLGAAPADARFFEHLIGPRGSFTQARPSAQVRLHPRHPFPVALCVAAGLFALLLALNELLSAPLRWGAPALPAGEAAA